MKDCKCTSCKCNELTNEQVVNQMEDQTKPFIQEDPNLPISPHRRPTVPGEGKGEEARVPDSSRMAAHISDPHL